MQLSKVISNALANLRFVVFPFVTCVNASVKRKLFVSGKKYKCKTIQSEKISNRIMFKNRLVSAIFYRYRCPFQKNCRYLPINRHSLTLVQNVGLNLKCILTKFELSTSCRFQDIAVLNRQFSSYSTSLLRFCQCYDRRFIFGKLAYSYLKSSLFTILTLTFISF